MNTTQTMNLFTVYTVEEAFDRIDKTFIEFYGEYGRKIVNTRRKEWNEAGNWNFKPLCYD